VSIGEAKNQIGVKSVKDGSGENCVRVSANEMETVTITTGDYFTSGTEMGAFDLDIQLKFDSRVKGEVLVDNNWVSTGPDFTGEGLSDNGPDSEDNRRWVYIAPNQGEFTEIRLTAVAGTFSIGGGQNIDEFGLFDPTSKGSQFVIGPVYDGELDCAPDSASIGVEGEDIAWGTVVMHAQDLDTSDNDSGPDGYTVDCRLKPFDADSEGAAISFIPADPIGVSTETNARYTIEATVEDQDVTTNEGGQVTSLEAVYNEDGSFDFGSAPGLPNCGFQPPTDRGEDGSDQRTLYEAFWTQDDPVDDSILTGGVDTGQGTLLLPENDIACHYYAGVQMNIPSADDPALKGDERWGIYLEFDPGFSWR
jgi:hypothetical protein